MENANDQSNVPHGLLTSVGKLFASPWFSLVAVAIALLLTFRSVHNGLILDDYYHRAVLSESPRFDKYLPGPQAMFRFIPRDPQQTREWLDIGLMPWFTDPNLKIDFFQRIPTQTHIFDYWLWPGWPALMHVHNLVWFSLIVFLAAKFYRRILGPTWMAGVAALLFAIEDSHALPAGWICNRNILIAASFGIGCLIAHDAWRRERNGWAIWLALVLWGASLCSKEAGIATCAYLFAYALWLDESTLWQRFLTLVPYGVVLVVWRAVRDSLEYGVANMGHYVDPISEPARFAAALLERYPIFLFGQWGGLTDAWALVDGLFGLGPPFWWTAMGYVCVLGLLFLPVLRRDRVARFFTTGMLLAAIPICAAYPMDRLLMFVGLGAFGLLVRFWYAVFAAHASRPNFSLWRAVAMPVALLLVLLHVVLAPLLLTVRAAAPLGPRELVEAGFFDQPFDETIETQDLVVINPPTVAMLYSLLNLDHEGVPIPRALRALAPGVAPVTVKRTDDRTIEVRPHIGYLPFPDNVLRNENNPLQVGDSVQLAGMTAAVIEFDEGRPRVVAFQFKTPLEDASLRWLRFHDGDFVPWTPPPMGEEVTLEPDWNPFGPLVGTAIKMLNDFW